MSQQTPGPEMAGWTLQNMKTAESHIFNPVELAKHHLGIVTSANLRLGDNVKVMNRGNSLPLKVVAAHRLKSETNSWSYSLLNEKLDIDLETHFKELLNILKPTSEQNPEATGDAAADVRAVRFQPDRVLSIAAKTFGSSGKHHLSAVNISKSGLLLATALEDVPFLMDTILELTVDPDHKWFSKPIELLGKVARIAITDGNRKNFGIKIVQIDLSFQ